MSKLWQSWTLRFIALFAISLSVFRAATQAITLDEAMTYLWYVRGMEGNHLWTPFPNNHVLNSMLIWATTHVFGPSPFSIRLPALFGAGIYVGCCYFLCRRITSRFSLQLPLFICLVFNPFVLDFMAVARGYSLANAFLLAAIAICIWHSTDGPSLSTSCALASLAVGLSFTANFSFAIIDLTVFVAILIWAVRQRGEISLIRILTLCSLPGLLVVLVIAGYPLTHWPPNELNDGARSLREMWGSLIEASLHQLDPGFANFKWGRTLIRFKPFLLPTLGILCILQLAASLLDGSWRAELRKQWLVRFYAALIAIISTTLLVHWVMYRWLDVLLPKTRTAIFLLPLCTLIAGVIAASPARSVVSQWLRRMTTAAFFCLAANFLLCLRVTYFEEYQWNADLKEVYSVLAELNHSNGLAIVEANGLYHASLDFYRRLSTTETFTEFSAMGSEPSAGKAAYVLVLPHQQEFIDKEGLRVVFHGKSTEVAVAIR